jgi:hypothetical protein
MSIPGFPAPNRAFGSLRSLALGPAPLERCELCSAGLHSVHQHLIEIARRRLLCVCDACAVLFTSQTSAKYKRVPRQIRNLGDFKITDDQWDSLMIPIGMAFFSYNSSERKMVAVYPSPAGPTESLLSLEAWQEIEQQNPVLRSMEPDVEALLVNRVTRAAHNGGSTAGPGYFLVPIDECYRLVGMIRQNWRGFSGGVEAWSKIGQFFEELSARAGWTPGGPPCLT